MKKVTAAVGDVVMVRLALLPGMSDKEPSAAEIKKLRDAHGGDPVAREELIKERMKGKDAPLEALAAQSISEEYWLHPRRRLARVTYVDSTGGGIDILPSGAPGPMKAATTNSINVEVKTVGSTVMQPAIGHYPKWAQETFRLDTVQFYDAEPEDAQDQHVAYPVPEAEEE